MDYTNTNKHWETKFILVAPVFSGSLSAISSALIIYVILRSQTRLSSIYHRIMFGMSLADVLSSIAVALTTLPMPSYMPKEEELQYRWTGGTPRLGNTYTCNAQGFFQTFGVLTTFHYNSMLCVYYACAIAFAMKEQTIKKYVEPFIHGIPILAGLTPSLSFLFDQMYNPQFGNSLPYTSWCTPSGYPMNCGDDENDQECIRGFNASKLLLVTTGVISAYCLFIMVASLTMVLRKVIQTKNILHGSRSKISSNIQDFTEKHTNTKVVFLQALFYVAAFLICTSPPFIRIISKEHHASEKVEEGLLAATLLLLPLQGFFNFLIFISHKVYNYRRVNKIATKRYVLWLLFCTSAHEPCFISRISILWDQEDSIDENVEQNDVLEVVTNDEGCSETMKYRLQIMLRGLESCDSDEASKADGNRVQSSYNRRVNEIAISKASSGMSFGSPATSASFPSASPFSVSGESSTTS
jgi:hypothetical protein